MYTQCPECGTVFRVTAPVLRAAQGQVRCGVCDTSFDALRFLTDDIEMEVNAASASRIVGEPADGRPAAAPSPSPAPSPSSPPPAAPPAPQPPPPPESPRAFGAATRNRPSADEERELGEIAAILARGAQPRSMPAPATAPPAAPVTVHVPDGDEINILEPSDVEDIVLGDEGAADIPDAALEFDLPAERWEQVFVRDPSAPDPALDLDFASTSPPGGSEPFEAPDELVILEAADDPLARTDEYRAPAFAADFELEPAEVGELGADEVTEIELAEVTDAAVAARAGRPEAAAPAPDEAVRALRAAPAWTPVPLEDMAGLPEEFAPREAAADGGARPGLPRGASVAAALLLALALGVQALHYYRDALAELPLIGPAVTTLYARLGMPIEPRWNLAAYDVRQWGAQSEEAAGVLRLRASIVNRATRAQPFPLLRVTLEDRFGAQVGRREFAPAEYLPGRAAPRELLGPGARADADLSLADPGNQAVGFELDVCLPRHDALACGADAKAGGN